MGKELIITLLLGYIAIVSLITYILYAVDKKRAKERRFRVPEKTLLLFSFIGGAFGGYIAMFTLRHKTK